MTGRDRCDTCQHPGRAHRAVTGNKKPCDCVCHQLPPERRRHRWPAWVTGDIEFEDAS